MKRHIFITAFLALAAAALPAMAQDNKSTEKYAEMTFQSTTHNFGLFDVAHGDQTCWFVFTNTGNKELLILSATSSCGCTVPEYPKTAVMPGMKDSIKVTYNGSTKRPGTFRKTIALTTNAKINSAYLYITGEMVEQLVEDRVSKPAQTEKPAQTAK